MHACDWHVISRLRTSPYRGLQKIRVIRVRWHVRILATGQSEQAGSFGTSLTVSAVSEILEAAYVCVS